jgi:hypothetical protein
LPEPDVLEVSHDHFKYGVTLEWLRSEQVWVNHGTGEEPSPLPVIPGGWWHQSYVTDSDNPQLQRAFAGWAPDPNYVHPEGEPAPQAGAVESIQAATQLKTSLHFEDRIRMCFA